MCIGAHIIERNLELSQTKEISTRTYTSSSLETSKKANKKKIMQSSPMPKLIFHNGSCKPGMFIKLKKERQKSGIPVYISLVRGNP